jgi:hypothetical protein
VVRQTIPVELDIRADRRLDVDVECRVSLDRAAKLDFQYSTTKWKTRTRFQRPMPWTQLLARPVADVERFYSGSSKYAPHGSFLSEGQGDGSPG